MTKTLIVLILLFDGTFIQKKIELPILMDVHQCMTFSENYREVIAEHSWNTEHGSVHYLKDGTGTLQGFIC